MYMNGTHTHTHTRTCIKYVFNLFCKLEISLPGMREHNKTSFSPPGCFACASCTAAAILSCVPDSDAELVSAVGPFVLFTLPNVAVAIIHPSNSFMCSARQHPDAGRSPVIVVDDGSRSKPRWWRGSCFFHGRITCHLPQKRILPYM